MSRASQGGVSTWESYSYFFNSVIQSTKLEGDSRLLINRIMPPPRNTTAYQGLQPQNGTEQGLSEEVLLLVAFLLIYVVFGLRLILPTGWKIVMEAPQQRGAAELPLSVEETNPHRGSYEPMYD